MTVRRALSCVKHGFTLFELLIVIALIGIFAGAMILSLESGTVQNLDGAAQVVVADLAYARNLAVTHGSTYKLTFNLDANRYVISHSGTNPQHDNLPPSAFKSPGDPSTEQSTDFDDLPHLGQAPAIAAVQKLTPAAVNVADIEFGPLGDTTRTEPTVIWLTCGSGTNQVYLSVTVDPVTGVASTSSIQSNPPPTGS